MQERQLYEFAVIRVVPKIEREEFLNVGVVLFSKNHEFLKMLYHLDENKLKLLCEACDMEQILLNLQSFEKICNADQSGGPIAQMDAASRFRWLTAVRSSVIQTSRPHPGLSTDLDITLKRLFQELVL